MHCYLCGALLDDTLLPSVPSTDGGRVHIACADRAALAAWKRRSLVACGSGILCFAILLIALLIHTGSLVLLVLLALIAGSHLWLNERWWRHMCQLLRRNTRYRYRGTGH